MNNRSNTYRFFSALTLILFFSSVALPSGISAAGLLCDMDMDEIHDTSQACCEVHDTKKAENHQADAADEHCNDDQICLHTLPQSETDAQAAVIHQGKDFAALAVVEEIQSSLDDHNKVRVYKSLLTIPHYSPPLFLLNSSFLN